MIRVVESIAEHDSCAEQRIRLIDTFFPGFLPGETFRANISNSLSLVLTLHTPVPPCENSEDGKRGCNSSPEAFLKRVGR